MATADQAPATAGGPTQHTQNQGPTLAPVPNLNTHGYTREEQIEALHKLREPFAPSEIRYLPRVWCKACRDAQGKVCNRPDHARRQCNKCGQNMTTAHLDLKFVGHAEATNRLLNVDPFWDWEPLATDANGLPQYDGNRGLWIRLTVCGMTRLGYGHADGKTGGDAVKEIIGDAIRNAGMRFGMALNLWTSSDLLILEYGEGAEDGAERSASPAAEAPQVPRSVPQQRAPERPRPQAQAAGPQPTPPVAGDLDRLLGQVQTNWDHRTVLEQVRAELDAKGLAVSEVQGPDGRWVKFGDLLDARLGEMAAGPGRSAA